MSIDLTYHAHVAQISLNNPDKRNVLDLETSNALKSAVEQATSNPDTKAILLTATGRAFCAGGSLDELLSAQEDTTQLGAIYEGFLAVARCPLPTLACVQGAAVGAGMNLALACDVRLVAPEASFDTRFLQLGIHCGGGHTWLLQRTLNWEQSVNALLLSQVIRGEAAVSSGLALACVSQAELREHGLKQLEHLSSVPRQLIEHSKASLLKAASEPDHAQMVQHEYDVQAWSLQQPHAITTLSNLKRQIAGK